MKRCKIDLESLKVLAPNYEQSELFNKLMGVSATLEDALDKYVMLSSLPVAKQNLLIDMSNRLGIDYEVISEEDAAECSQCFPSISGQESFKPENATS